MDCWDLERNGSGRGKMSGMSEMGGNKTYACFCRTPEIQFFFFFGVDVEDATSTRDGRWADGRWTLRISLIFE
jgi:hypothetical protein